ncbi:hypothetical protein Verru16b_02825 [Lacunisphaera limnophila]|uniref:Glycosyltransferase subfamily 4-like N-terminal domain-containing protein n=1 Tax=Lacunisphaera limnophila TaxID=1838286 RepID=A0A1D8AXX0_9BACT|nr:hypothetical protein [Lacunisphaera limnophila]AOS45738.1 hypothetical protein Verru16b_02825 [Lacunisphaera limnophila]
MPAPDPRSAIFVTAQVALNAEGGGVQRCTHEYLTVLRAAGFKLHLTPYPFEHRLWVRVLRKIRPQPYRDAVPRGFADRIREAALTHQAGWILLNQSEAAPLALELADLRQAGCRIALLSHGVDSTDYIHVARIREELHRGAPWNNRDNQWLGLTLFEEQRQHRNVDAVLCLSETDRVQEQWLGAGRVTVVPRVIGDRRLDWQPVAGRIGTVSTLTHEPNLEGLVLLGRELARTPVRGLRLRLVGSPQALGQELARQFPFVDYLGALSDAALAEEARTWCAFANPLFCYPRGCSTKLALPLEWRLPVATTRAGARGYHWDETLVPLVETPVELAALIRRLADPVEAGRQRPAVDNLALHSPRPEDVARLVQHALR